jgi:hypothetical protein
MLRPIAALWEHTSQKFSLNQWVKEESILLLGCEESLRQPLDAINRILFQRITELVLAQPESDTQRTWFFLDELKEAGKLDALPRLLTKGRTKGARVLLATQTIEGLRDTFGEKSADELVGMCGNKCLLRTDSHVTAQWMSTVIGDAEVRRWTESVTRGYNQGSRTMAEQILKMEAVLPSQMMHLRPPHNGRLFGYYISPEIGVFHGPVDFARGLKKKGQAPNFVPRPVEEQYLIDQREHDTLQAEFTLDDIQRITKEPDIDSADAGPEADEPGFTRDFTV